MAIVGWSSCTNDEFKLDMIRKEKGRMLGSSTPTSPVSPAPPTFNDQFANIIRTFRSHCLLLQKLLNDTDKSYDEITNTKVLPPEQAETIQLLINDRDYLESLITRPLALIVCSQNYSGKARFVNELLHEKLLPEPPAITKDDIVRMIRIKHSPSFGASLTLFGCFELLDTEKLFHDV
ncbi:unnamed protein product, partial [Didymodactylos carnosus]